MGLFGEIVGGLAHVGMGFLTGGPVGAGFAAAGEIAKDLQGGGGSGQADGLQGLEQELLSLFGGQGKGGGGAESIVGDLVSLLGGKGGGGGLAGGLLGAAEKILPGIL